MFTTPIAIVCLCLFYLLFVLISNLSSIYKEFLKVLISYDPRKIILILSKKVLKWKRNVHEKEEVC